MKIERWFPPENLLDDQIKVLVVGAGGTGSQVAQGLAPLHGALIALGHPKGLDVTLMDPSKVREANIGRQPYYSADVGQPKAHALATRINAQYSSQGFTMASVVTGDIEHIACSQFRRYDFIISCVDTKAARSTIHQITRSSRSLIWLDTGNRADDGQVVMGVCEDRNGVTIPTVADLYPEIIDLSVPDDNAPSCSVEEALAKQSLFVNREIALHALDMLSRFLRAGLTHHARIINLAQGKMNSIPLDPQVWAAMGYRHPSLDTQKIAA